MPARFQRARKPEEKEVRRRAILAAARALMDEVGISALSLNELARRARLSKANVYNYFEGREEVLLHLWLEELRGLKERLEAAFAGLRRGDVKGVAAEVASSFAASERLCELTASVTTELERNLSSGAILNAKLSLAGLALEIAGLLQRKLPKLSAEDAGYAATAIATYEVGLYAASHPVPAAKAVLDCPELAMMRIDFKEGLARFAEVLFKGLGA